MSRYFLTCVLFLYATACSPGLNDSVTQISPDRERPSSPVEEPDATSVPEDDIISLPAPDTGPVTYRPEVPVFEASPPVVTPTPPAYDGVLPSHAQEFSIDTVATAVLIGDEDQGEFGHRLGKSLAVIDTNLLVQSAIDVRIYTDTFLSDITPGVFAGVSVGDMGANGSTEVLLEQTNDPSWERGVKGSIEVHDTNLFYHGSVLQDHAIVQGSAIEGLVLSNGDLAVASPLTYDGYAGALFVLSPEVYEGDVAVSYATRAIYTGVDPNYWGQMVVTEWNEHLVIGMPADTTLGTTGVVYVLPVDAPSGPLDEIATLRVILDADIRLGQVLANIGDIDADGDDELAIGLPEMNSPGWGAAVGEVFILPGGEEYRPITYLEDHVRLYPRHAGARTGAGVHRLGDVNDDGYEDLGVHAPGVAQFCLYFGTGPKDGMIASHPVCITGFHEQFGRSAVYLSESQTLAIGSPHEYEERGAVYYVHMVPLLRRIE